jgi:hypothetical protein
VVAAAYLTTNPALESCSINTVHNSDIIKVDVLDVGGLRLVGAQGADAHAVGLVANGTALEENVVRAGTDSNSVVSVVNDAVPYGDVRATDIEAIRVEWEGG